MKRTSLTNQQRDVLETLLAKHGLLVTSDQVAGELSFANAQSKRRFVSTLVEAGWLVRIQRGLYQIADISSLGTLTLSRLTIAQLIVPNSYVSFGTALQHHGLYDQALKSVISVALRQRAPVELEGTTYSFVRTQQRTFFGFEELHLDGRRVRVATPEKALVDLLQFKRTDTTVEIALEVLRLYGNALNTVQLSEWALQSPIAVQRAVGFLLDTAGLSASDALEAAARRSTSTTHLTPESSIYSRRWRLYVDPWTIDGKDLA
jgi:predicted transcriptional regulator of viral defense system